MIVHLTSYDVVAMIKGAKTSVQISDEGESFVEEAIGCFEEDELETFEDEYGGPLEEFFLEIFELWDEDEPENLPLLVLDALGELDIEMTYDEVDPEDEDDWEEEIDDPIEEAFEEY